MECTVLQAIETSYGYGIWLHGEAVAAGMVAFFDIFNHQWGERYSSLFDLERIYAEGGFVHFSGYGY